MYIHTTIVNLITCIIMIMFSYSSQCTHTCIHEVPTIADINVMYVYYRLPPLSTPKTAYFFEVLPDAFTIAVVSYSVSISLSKVFALKKGYIIHANQVFMFIVCTMYHMAPNFLVQNFCNFCNKQRNTKLCTTNI